LAVSLLWRGKRGSVTVSLVATAAFVFNHLWFKWLKMKASPQSQWPSPFALDQGGSGMSTYKFAQLFTVSQSMEGLQEL